MPPLSLSSMTANSAFGRTSSGQPPTSPEEWQSGTHLSPSPRSVLHGGGGGGGGGQEKLAPVPSHVPRSGAGAVVANPTVAPPLAAAAAAHQQQQAVAAPVAQPASSLLPRKKGQFEHHRSPPTPPPLDPVRNIYVTLLPKTMTDAGLYALASQFGSIESHKAIIDPDTGECKGFGFIMFSSVAEAYHALAELNRAGFSASPAKASFTSTLRKYADKDSRNLYLHGFVLY